MDDVKRLEREINDLQSRLRRQSAEAEKARKKLIEDNKRSLREYRSEMQRAIRTHDETARAEYERLLRQYEQSVNGDVQAELARVNSGYARLLEDVKRNEQLLMQKNQELERAIDEIKSDTSRRDMGSRQEAAEYMQRAVDTFRVTEVKPHEKFMPKRMQIYYNALRDGQQLYKAGMFEASAAVALSAKAGLERLGFTVDDKAEEWDKQYDLFSFRLSFLLEKLRQELDDWIEYVGIKDGEKKPRLIEINFWSRGGLEKIMQNVKRFRHISSEMNEKGRDAYLKQKDSPSTDDLKKLTEEVAQADKELEAMSALYKQRYTASCERAEWGEKIIDFLTGEINLEWEDTLTGYREADAETLKSREFTEYTSVILNDSSVTEDTREWLRLVFKNSSENSIYVYIVPVEQKGRVENRIILHIDYGGPEQEIYTRDIYAHILEAVSLTEDDEGVVNYAADLNELKVSANKTYSDMGRDLERMKRGR